MQPAPGSSRTWIDVVLDVATAIGLVVLILIGFATSYHTLTGLAATIGGFPPWLAPAVPLSFDLGIVVLSLMVTRAARDGRLAPILRLLVAALSATTVLANAAAVDGLAPRLLHLVPSAVFVICFETVTGTARQRALARQGHLPEPLPRIAWVAWLLAPGSTWQKWRAEALAQLGSGAPPSHQDPAVGVGAEGPVNAKQDTNGAGGDPRLKVACDFVRAEPDGTATLLAQLLNDRGHAVSVRTAQRLKAAAHERTFSGM